MFSITIGRDELMAYVPQATLTAGKREQSHPDKSSVVINYEPIVKLFFIILSDEEH